ncbi:feruloyl-CoA synthase [Jiulongibacter sp. NS-SX5]|uniref:feruloyl-CoA synthase n=1 Tax=Jiulongibacter sp. NS-SX5 TaxID=3463854 RepID=UPI0040595DED
MSDYKKVNFGPTQTILNKAEDGTIYYANKQKLGTYPKRLTDKLIHWATSKPNSTFIARKKDGIWHKLSYAETLHKVKCIAQYLIDMKFSKEETIVILSENSLEHALFSLAAVHIGVTYSPISPPYSLVSNDFEKLKHCLLSMTPKVVFVQDETKYAKALEFIRKLMPEVTIISVSGESGVDFNKLLETEPNQEVDFRANQVDEDTIAKVLFTSGSTGLPKGVMNHHGMWCSNLQQITQVFPFMEDTPPVFVDWLPWNHTFGGNHNFGLALYNGGTLYIDDGKPSQIGIKETIQNLKEISPTAYFNVPIGFELLVEFLADDEEIRKTFFKKLEIIFYAGASLAQPVWNKLEELAIKTVGHKVPIITGLGCTESGPSAMFANWGGAFSGLLGVPVAGMEVKLVPDQDKLEARYKAPNVTKGYWRNEVETLKVFDDQGYYKTGDAVKFYDGDAPDKGLIFDGRIAEDFKLSTGTWVSVGVLKAKVLSTGSPLIKDVVFTGLDQSFIGAILFLNEEAERKLKSTGQVASDFLDEWLSKFNQSATGSSNRIGKYLIAKTPPSIDLGEITDKGSLNQRQVLKHRAHLIEEMYAYEY